MAIRVGITLSVIVVVVGIAVATWGQGETPPDLDFIYPILALVYGGIALVVIWVGVIVAVVVGKARKRRRLRG